MDALDMYTSGVELGAVEIGAARARVNQTAGKIQRLMAGLPRTAVAAAGTATLNTTVSEPFRPERLILSTAAQALDVQNLTIGTKSLNVSTEVVSGNCFAPDAVGSHVVGYTAQAGVGFAIQVVNNTAGSITTGGGMFGLALN